MSACRTTLTRADTLALFCARVEAMAALLAPADRLAFWELLLALVDARLQQDTRH